MTVGRRNSLVELGGHETKCAWCAALSARGAPRWVHAEIKANNNKNSCKHGHNLAERRRFSFGHATEKRKTHPSVSAYLQWIIKSIGFVGLVHWCKNPPAKIIPTILHPSPGWIGAIKCATLYNIMYSVQRGDMGVVFFCVLSSCVLSSAGISVDSTNVRTVVRPFFISASPCNAVQPMEHHHTMQYSPWSITI